jgi:transposase
MMSRTAKSSTVQPPITVKNSAACAGPRRGSRCGTWARWAKLSGTAPPRDPVGESVEDRRDVAPVVNRLCCLRGIGTLTGFGLAVEVGDWHRFTGSTIGSYLGLVPSESSSGARRSQGGITKTGNSHARRLLVEAAWHHRKPYRPSRELLRRQAGQSVAVRDRAARGNRRLHRRWARLDARGKRSTISAVAVARKLAGWIWSWPS